MASIISVPAAIVISVLMVPLAGVPTTPGSSCRRVRPPAPWMQSLRALSTGSRCSSISSRYLDLARLPDGTLSPRTRMLMTYALCGFANFGSLGILIGGLATMAPERRGEIVALGWKSIVAGTLATCSTGAVVGMLWTG